MSAASRPNVYEIMSLVQVEGALEPAFEYFWEAVRNASETQSLCLPLLTAARTLHAQLCSSQLPGSQVLSRWRDEAFVLALGSVHLQALLTSGKRLSAGFVLV